ncbi:MAG: hypothetical protein AAF639_26750 [Chloroflexota bacterium]
MSQDKFHVLPINRVVTAVDDEEIAKTICDALIDVGFDKDKATILHGQEGLDYLDLDGSRHGFFTKMVRKYQSLSGPEARLIEQGQAALDHNRYIVSVWTGGSEEDRFRAFEIMSPHTERSIFFCGHSMISVLKVGQNYGRETEYEKNL